jgi:hypothetical protein
MNDDSRTPDLVGRTLKRSINGVLEGIAGSTASPTSLARRLDISRVMVSRMLNAVGKENPKEILTSIPGPETLRSFIRAANESGVDSPLVQAAFDSIDDFDDLIRNQFGTRAALNAALSVDHAETRDRFEQSSRYQIFKGMSQVLGVQSQTWLTCMMLTPSDANDHSIDITVIHGTSGLRRLRPDTPVHFIYGMPPKFESGQTPERMKMDLGPFLTHTPAPLSVREENGQIINTFAPKLGGKDALYDMLAAVHIPNGSDRFAAPGNTRRGTSVFPDVPVVTLVSDVILHGDIFAGIEPELFVYKTMGKGEARIDDPTRDTDRVETNEQIMDLGAGISELEISGIPKYKEMVNYLSEQNGYSPEEFRIHRLQVQYPVYGFQYLIGYKVPNVAGESITAEL